MDKVQKKIVATLKHGKILSVGSLAFLYFAIVLSCAMIIVLFDIAASYNNYKILIFELFPAFLIFVSIMFLVSDRKAKQDIKKWKRDAVLLQAYCEEVYNPKKMLNKDCIGQISISFVYNGEEINLFSQKTANAKFDPMGTLGSDKVFRQFINKKVNILYSPSYHEAMLLKQDKV